MMFYYWFRQCDRAREERATRHWFGLRYEGWSSIDIVRVMLPDEEPITTPPSLMELYAAVIAFQRGHL